MRGALENKKARVRILRLRRKGSRNLVRVLDPDRVKAVWSDPLLRYSRVLDGLFHEGVIVCEGDTDCRFYSAIFDHVDLQDQKPDLMFVYGGGKARVASIVDSLQAIGVPTKAILDFDVLSDEIVLSRIVEAFGGNWAALKVRWATVKKSIEKVRASLSVDDIRTQVTSILDEVRSTNLKDETISQISKILRKGSGWQEAKRLGSTYIPSGDEQKVFDDLDVDLRRLGIFIVKVGEVEGFYRKIGGKGPKWALSVLELDLAKDDDLEPARTFVRQIVERWRDM